jgi:hypothetical protein
MQRLPRMAGQPPHVGVDVAMTTHFADAICVYGMRNDPFIWINRTRSSENAQRCCRRCTRGLCTMRTLAIFALRRARGTTARNWCQADHHDARRLTATPARRSARGSCCVWNLTPAIRAREAISNLSSTSTAASVSLRHRQRDRRQVPSGRRLARPRRRWADSASANAAARAVQTVPPYEPDRQQDSP